VEQFGRQRQPDHQDLFSADDYSRRRCGAGLVDLALSFLIQIGLMFYYRIAFTPRMLMAPVLVLLATLLAISVGMWLSALNVKYRDIRYAFLF